MPKLARRFRPRHPASAKNGRPHAVTMKYGGTSALRAARVDQRTPEAHFENNKIAARVQHAGGADVVTEPLLSIIRHSARLELLVALAYAEVLRVGVVHDGAVSGAFQAFLTAGRELRGTLELIGLERKQKPVPSLAEYLAQQPAQATDLAEQPGIPTQPGNGESNGSR